MLRKGIAPPLTAKSFHYEYCPVPFVVECLAASDESGRWGATSGPGRTGFIAHAAATWVMYMYRRSFHSFSCTFRKTSPFVRLGKEREKILSPHKHKYNMTLLPFPSDCSNNNSTAQS